MVISCLSGHKTIISFYMFQNMVNTLLYTVYLVFHRKPLYEGKQEAGNIKKQQTHAISAFCLSQQDPAHKQHSGLKLKIQMVTWLIATYFLAFSSELRERETPICKTFSIFRHFSLCRDLHFNRFDLGSIPQVLRNSHSG